jgi:hypothetical protein
MNKLNENGPWIPYSPGLREGQGTGPWIRFTLGLYQFCFPLYKSRPADPGLPLVEARAYHKPGPHSLVTYGCRQGGGGA